MTTVSEAMAGHQAWLAMRKAEGTRTKYAQHLRPFAAWAGDRSIAEVTASEIETGFLTPWAIGKKPSTVRVRITALKSLFEYCEKFLDMERNPMRKIDAPEADSKMGNWLRPEQDVRLLESCKTPDEKIIVWLLRFTGLRVSEACQLEWADVDFTNTRITVKKSKTKAGVRVIYIHPMLLPVLRKWKDQRPGPYVLATRKGTAMATNNVWRVVKRVGLRIGEERLGPHSLRRTFGSSEINAGKLDLLTISKILGHSSVAVTQKSYAELLDETITARAAAAWGAS